MLLSCNNKYVKYALENKEYNEKMGGIMESVGMIVRKTMDGYLLLDKHCPGGIKINYIELVLMLRRFPVFWFI